MQDEETLQWMLEEAKKHPTKVHCDFDTRYRVWVNKIIPGRLSEIIQGGGDPEYIMRMINLTLADCERLAERIYKEMRTDDDCYSPQHYTGHIVDVYTAGTDAIGEYIKETKYDRR